MKNLVRILILLLFCNSYLHSQEYFSFGNSSSKLMAGIPSPPIKIKAVPKFTYKFGSKIGGVYFEQTLSSDMDISVNYAPDNPDGYRLEVIANGIRFNPFLADWQLIPIAEFSNTEYVAAVSLFGPNTSETSFDIVYHEAFQNTLLGLRLLQADMMLIDIEKFYKLPMFEDQYVLLGNGENNDSNIDEEEIKAIGIDMALLSYVYEYESWIFNDKNNLIEIDANSETLVKGDKPYYYFWKSAIKNDESFKNKLDSLSNSYKESVINKINESEIINTRSLADTISVIDIINNFGENQSGLSSDLESEFINSIDSIMENALISIECEELNQEFKKSYYEDEILIPSFQEKIEKINPMVYKAADNTTKYSALFRYIKESNPDIWNQFMSKIVKAEISPKINTPTRLLKE